MGCCAVLSPVPNGCVGGCGGLPTCWESPGLSVLQEPRITKPCPLAAAATADSLVPLGTIIDVPPLSALPWAVSEGDATTCDSAAGGATSCGVTAVPCSTRSLPTVHGARSM
eukprot:EG_transcript_13004